VRSEIGVPYICVLISGLKSIQLGHLKVKLGDEGVDKRGDT
jgi:hypothetical protein